MSGIIQGFNYDVFISYRQNDNRYDGWVTEFVENLRKELDATIKDKLSIYFDSDPYDGLLETDTVDRSLETKLNCLIFIPVISRTYCDSRSYAWNSEFLAFLRTQQKDSIGLDVRLRNGNVASRVLPVRIHDIKQEDCKLIEENFGPLRSIDFIYKAPGVNRPLRSNEDHPHANLNKLYYRDQINKVANAIDEIITGIKALQEVTSEKSFYAGPQNAAIEAGRKKIRPGIIDGQTLKKAGYSIFILALIFSLILNWKDIFSSFSEQKREEAKAHIETAISWFENGDYDSAEKETRLALEDDPDYSYAWSTLAAISVRRGDLNNAVLQTIEAIKFDPSNKEAAYNLAFALEDKKDFLQAKEWYSKSIQVDSGFIPAYSALGRLYNQQNQPVDAILLLSIARKRFSSSEYIYLIHKNLGNAYLLQGLHDSAIKYLELSTRINPDEAETSLFLARAYETAGKIDKSIEAWQKYIQNESDTLKIHEAKIHLKEITISHLKKIIE
jgi:tetratricopeptide (TPR) repeat protein